MPHHTSLIAILCVGFVLAFVLGLLAQRLRLSPLVGYLVAGILAGPFTPGFVGDQTLAPQLAEIGVILLMFGVGLHFSLRDLMAVKAIALPGAVIQIAVATVLGWALARWLGWSHGAGLMFGLALSVASTVVLLRALEERRLLETGKGRIAIGWLIVEDLAMVLALVLLPALAGTLGGESSGEQNVWLALLLTLGKVAGFVAVMLIVGRRAIPWVLERVAGTGSRELFTLCVLAIAMGVAFGAAELFGVSFALGAFFAGMLLNESEFSHKAAQDSLPMRDAFAVLFFVSVGMLFDPHIVVEQPLAILATFLIIVFGKSVAAWAIVRAFGKSHSTALTISASLAQIGEFSFILAGLGLSLKILPQAGHDLILAGALLSIVVNPFLFTLLDRWQAKQDARAAALVPEPEGTAAAADREPRDRSRLWPRRQPAGQTAARTRRAGRDRRGRRRSGRAGARGRLPERAWQRRFRARDTRGASGSRANGGVRDPECVGNRRSHGQAACDQPGADPARPRAQRRRSEAPAGTRRRRRRAGRARTGLFAGRNGDGDAAVPAGARPVARVEAKPIPGDAMFHRTKAPGIGFASTRATLFRKPDVRFRHRP